MKKTATSFRTLTITIAGAFILSGCVQMGDFGGSLPSLSPVKVNIPGLNSGGGSSQVVDRGMYKAIVASPGDTMTSLATKAGVDVNALATTNGVAVSYQPRTGQEFVIPGTGASTGKINPPKPTTPTDAGSGTKNVSHTVRGGETIYSIARLYGVSVARLAAANDLGADLAVNEGQTITIPADDVAIDSPTTTETASTKPASPTVPDVNDGKFSKPVSGSIETGYNPGSGSDGYIYSTSSGSPVKAVGSGTVVLISESTGANGTIVMVKHSNGLISVYGRLGSVSVTKGQSVSKGQSVGTTAGSKLLFQLREGTAAIDPARYMS